MVKAKVLDVDVEKERISLGIKQLGGDPLRGRPGELTQGPVVTCEVTEVKEGGIEVKIADTDLDRLHPARRPRARPRRAAPRALRRRREGRCPRHQLRPKARKVQVSIKALEMAEEKEAVAQYGSSDSGASLGDILGAALKKASKPARASKPTPYGNPGLAGIALGRTSPRGAIHAGFSLASSGSPRYAHG